ncbi:MAG: porin family protein [Acidobacteria bacterium]|nr:porin family protein [Acidobacteriota bacterium]
MLRRATWMAAACLLVASLSWAQDSRVEVSATAGWTFGDGVSGPGVVVPGAGTFTGIGPSDGLSWGLRLGIMASKHAEIGFLFNQQPTEIEITGTSTVKLGDESIRNYHGYIGYNLGGAHARVRPYLLVGLGGTQYGTVKASAGGVQRDIIGSTRFSSTAALGVKVFPGPKVGIRLEGRWTPTRVDSDVPGWWCDPYWGCYLTEWYPDQARPSEVKQYSHHFELSGGLILRF